MPRSVKSIFTSAGDGIYRAFLQEKNMKVHGIAAIAALLLAGILQIGMVKTAIILLCIAFVFAVELMNTALEVFIDFIVEEEYYWAAAKAKDMAAGAVLCAAIFALFIGLLFFLPPIWILLTR